MRVLSVIGLLFILMNSCNSSDGGETPQTDSFNRQAILTNWANNIIMPAYDDLYTVNNDLNESVQLFIDNPSTSTLNQAREAHKDAYITWQKVAFFEIGPAKNENLRLYFNKYPSNTSMIDELALQSEYNLHLSSNASRQGYPALDYLLNGFADNDIEIINKFSTDANATHYKNFIRALTQRLVDKTSTVKLAWENGYKDSFIANDGSSTSASVDLIANDFLLYYEKFFRNAKVRFPLGYTSGTPSPINVESYYSPELSKELLITSNTAMRDFFVGKYYNNAQEGDSFKSYLIELNKDDVAEDIIALFNATNAAANQINSTFREAVENDRPGMLNLHDRIQENVIPMKVDMLQAMNISVAYFDGDGD